MGPLFSNLRVAKAAAGWGTGIRTPIARARILRPAVRRSPKGFQKTRQQMPTRRPGGGEYLFGRSCQPPFSRSRGGFFLPRVSGSSLACSRPASRKLLPSEEAYLTCSAFDLRCAPVLATSRGECQLRSEMRAPLGSAERRPHPPRHRA